MREIKKWVVTGYEANDGTVFETQEECVRYEDKNRSIKERYDAIPKFKNASHGFFGGKLIGDVECEMEIIFVKDKETLDVINQYLATKTYCDNYELNNYHLGKYVMIAWSWGGDSANITTTDDYIRDIIRSVEEAKANIK